MASRHAVPASKLVLRFVCSPAAWYQRSLTPYRPRKQLPLVSKQMPPIASMELSFTSGFLRREATILNRTRTSKVRGPGARVLVGSPVSIRHLPISRMIFTHGELQPMIVALYGCIRTVCLLGMHLIDGKIIFCDWNSIDPATRPVHSLGQPPRSRSR